MATQAEVTELLEEAGRGNREAADRLLPVVYDELRRLAQHHLQSERPDHTLQATELVHEAYLRLIDQSRVTWANRNHFFALAAQAMRRILVDHARRRGRKKRGAGRLVPLTDPIDRAAPGRPMDLLALDLALKKLAANEPEKERVVELRYFAGLSAGETAQVMGLGKRTVERYWVYARTWLYRELESGAQPSP